MSETKTLAIDIKDLVKLYKSKIKHKEVLAVNKLNLQIEKGDVFGFIGPNGAGKTTTIKVLTGLIKPTSGKAFIFDKVAGTVDAKKYIGYLSEVSYYYPFIEADLLLKLYARLYDMQEELINKRVYEVLDLVGLSKFASMKIGSFSKGMQQRFSIAQAIIHDPEVLILDEPTSGLDPIVQKEVMDILFDFKAKGKTIFFSSHRLEEVENLCTKVGIINKGKLLFLGTLDELKQKYMKKIYEIKVQYSGEVDNIQDKKLNYRKIDKDIYLVVSKNEQISEIKSIIDSIGGKILNIQDRSPNLNELFIDIISNSNHQEVNVG